MKQKIINSHGTLRAFAVAIDKSYSQVLRVVGKAEKGDPVAVAKVLQWLGNPLRLWTRGELMAMVSNDGGLAEMQERISKQIPKANLLAFFNKVSAPQRATPLYLSICRNLGIAPYKEN